MDINDIVGHTPNAPVAGRTDALARKAWAAERQYRFGATRRYSRFVDVMKVALPLLAVGLLMLMIAWSILNETPLDMTWKSEMTKVVAGRIEMTAPQLTFTDEEGRDVFVEAKLATQEKGKSDQWTLDTIHARMTPLEGEGYSLLADSGQLDSEQQLLDLSGNVKVESSSGYTFKAKSAHVDLNAGRVTSEEPVEAQGGATRVVANRFEMWDRGDRFRFEGDVHFTSEPVAKAAAADAP